MSTWLLHFFFFGSRGDPVIAHRILMNPGIFQDLKNHINGGRKTGQVLLHLHKENMGGVLHHFIVSDILHYISEVTDHENGK